MSLIHGTAAKAHHVSSVVGRGVWMLFTICSSANSYSLESATPVSCFPSSCKGTVNHSHPRTDGAKPIFHSWSLEGITVKNGLVSHPQIKNPMGFYHVKRNHLT